MGGSASFGGLTGPGGGISEGYGRGGEGASCGGKLRGAAGGRGNSHYCQGQGGDGAGGPGAAVKSDVYCLNLL